MSTSFPSSLDSFVNPTAASPRNNPSLAGQQSDQNDAIQALEAKIGINNSVDPTSLDFKVQALQGSLIPSGGTTGQVLVKRSNLNYDAGWNNITDPPFVTEELAIAYATAL